MSRTKILIADEHEILRRGMKLLINLHADLHTVGEARCCEEVLRKTQVLRPNVLVLDVSMSGSASTEVIELVTDSYPNTHVLVFTMLDDDTTFRAAMNAGATGYVIKSSTEAILMEAIRSVAKGQKYTQLQRPKSCTRSAVFDSLAGTNGTKRLDALSKREREVFVLVAKGNTNQAIANQMAISVKTIESYRARIMFKLELQNRAELTQLAIDAGLMTSQPRELT